MGRINITEADEYTSEPTLVGWFDPDKATEIAEDTDWDGSNHISVATGSQSEHECLYRTAGGRWVLHGWSQWQGTLPSYRFVADEQAREWLLRNGRDEAVEEHFGAVEPERGPGRPEIGGAVHVRLGDLLPAVDAAAADAGVSRAEWVRSVVHNAVLHPGEHR